MGQGRRDLPDDAARDLHEGVVSLALLIGAGKRADGGNGSTQRNRQRRAIRRAGRSSGVTDPSNGSAASQAGRCADRDDRQLAAVARALPPIVPAVLSVLLRKRFSAASWERDRIAEEISATRSRATRTIDAEQFAHSESLRRAARTMAISESRRLSDGSAGVTLQERQRPLIEFCDVLVERRVRTPFEDEELGIADAALESIPETRRRQLIVTSECDLRRRGNSAGASPRRDPCCRRSSRGSRTSGASACRIARRTPQSRMDARPGSESRSFERWKEIGPHDLPPETVRAGLFGQSTAQEHRPPTSDVRSQSPALA